ncbi:MAG: F0F1 ATP synthase subunit delta [Patescibacteria group bacterium]|nr:F0F1 ATP synthase subunit delta [Patescibacteria group bacterium]
MIKNKIKTYAQALVESLSDIKESEVAERVENFKKLLKKRRDLKIAPAIFKEFERMWDERAGKRATLVTAEPLSGKARRAVELSLKRKGFQLRERVDKSVLGGAALFLGDNFLIDGTVANKVRQVFINRYE